MNLLKVLLDARGEDSPNRTIQVPWLYVMAIPLAFLFLFFSGLFPYLGYAQGSLSSVGVGGISIAGHSGGGTQLGVKNFFFLRGQTVFINYDAEVRKGAIQLALLKRPTIKRQDRFFITETSAGTYKAEISETGLYQIIIEPNVVHGEGVGYDYSYKMSWGARF